MLLVRWITGYFKEIKYIYKNKMNFPLQRCLGDLSDEEIKWRKK